MTNPTLEICQAALEAGPMIRVSNDHFLEVRGRRHFHNNVVRKLINMGLAVESFTVEDNVVTPVVKSVLDSDRMFKPKWINRYNGHKGRKRWERPI